MDRRYAVVILAAGASSRLGRAKQLVAYRGKPLVAHVAEAALQSGAAEVVVVVGAEGDSIRGPLTGLTVRVVENPEWREGMGSSIRCGVAALEDSIECIVIALCDQPRITADLLRELANRHFETGSPIVASSYDGVTGAPSAFGRTLFPALMALDGDSGAREIIRHSPIQIETVAFSGGRIDVDTPADLDGLEGFEAGVD